MTRRQLLAAAVVALWLGLVAAFIKWRGEPPPPPDIPVPRPAASAPPPP